MRRRLPRTVIGTLLCLTLLATGCGSSNDSSADTTDTVAETSTSAAASTTEAHDSISDPQVEAVWPTVNSELRFSSPEDAASSFATDFLGFVDPHLSEVELSDADSGSVVLTKRSDGGPATTVELRQLGEDEAWWVTGSSTDNIHLVSVDAGDEITSPVSLTGESTAFEATVNFEIRADDQPEPLAEDVFMGGSMGEMGEFVVDAQFEPDDAEYGSIVLFTYSMEDGNVSEATVVRVKFP